MKTLRLTAVFFFTLFCLFMTQANAATYVLDDGAAENAIGWSGGGTLTWLNQFTAAGSDTITSIEVAWGYVAEGTAATVMLWEDPNGDGNPTDRSLLRSLAVSVSNAAPLGSFPTIFNVYDIPDVSVSGSFFVGVEITHAAGEHPALLDQTTPQQKSWIGSDYEGLTWALIDSYGWQGNWTIRANGGGTSPVPEPATMLLLGLGLMGLGGFRRLQK